MRASDKKTVLQGFSSLAPVAWCCFVALVWGNGCAGRSRAFELEPEWNNAKFPREELLACVTNIITMAFGYERPLGSLEATRFVWISPTSIGLRDEYSYRSEPPITGSDRAFTVSRSVDDLSRSKAALWERTFASASRIAESGIYVQSDGGYEFQIIRAADFDWDNHASHSDLRSEDGYVISIRKKC